MSNKQILDDFTDNLYKHVTILPDGESIVNFYDAIEVLRCLLSAKEVAESMGREDKRYDFWDNEI